MSAARAKRLSSKVDNFGQSNELTKALIKYNEVQVYKVRFIKPPIG